MQINVHHPTVANIYTLNHGDDDKPFHIIQLADLHGGGILKLFIRGDWSDWDQLVTDVAAYRSLQKWAED
jgi:hypothetical protein